MRRPYGKRCSNWYTSKNATVQFPCLAEMWRADTLELLWQANEILDWDYQPPPFDYPYKYRGKKLSDGYTPDFRVWYSDHETGAVWSVYEEVKRGWLDQKYASKIKRACKEHGDKLPLRLIWYGSLPTTGATKKNLDRIRPYLLDIQFERTRK